jgi:hypothetical protein
VTPLAAWRVYAERDYWRRVVSDRTLFPTQGEIKLLRESD